MNPEGRSFRSGVLWGASGALVIVALLFLVIGPTLAGLFDRLEDVFGEQSRASEAQDEIRQNYFKPVGSSTLENASVDGMIDALHKRYGDKFSHYFDPAALR